MYNKTLIIFSTIFLIQITTFGNSTKNFSNTFLFSPINSELTVKAYQIKDAIVSELIINNVDFKKINVIQKNNTENIFSVEITSPRIIDIDKALSILVNINPYNNICTKFTTLNVISEIQILEKKQILKSFLNSLGLIIIIILIWQRKIIA
jgi:hypothetical protein